MGAQYSYDPILDDFIKDTSPYGGSIFAEDANTIGKGRLNLGFIYSRQKFKRFEGESLNDLVIDLTHYDINSDGNTSPCIGGPPDACYTFEQDVVRLNIDLDLEQEVAAFVGTYGVLENLDLGIVVPIVKTKVTSLLGLLHCRRQFPGKCSFSRSPNWRPVRPRLLFSEGVSHRCGRYLSKVKVLGFTRQ